jgi:hypothetical protein
MTVLASILLFALTRAEIIDRFRAVPTTMCGGLVKVYGDCPADMRKEFQGAVASFAAATCRELYAAEAMKEGRFAAPGIVIHIGDVRTNVTNVVTRVMVRDEGEKFMRIFVPAPGYADRAALTRAVVRGYYLAVKKEEIDEAAAEEKWIAANPDLRIATELRRLADWRERGIYAAGKTDEDYLTLQRKVLVPGIATMEDVKTFAARLRLYPLTYAAPFGGKHLSCTFSEAITLAHQDPAVRFAAYIKSRQLPILAGGRGEELNAVAVAYANFLFELARLEKTDLELAKLLADADEKMKGLLNENK